MKYIQNILSNIFKICSQNEIGKPVKKQLLVQNIPQIINNLGKELGEKNAKQQVKNALIELGMDKYFTKVIDI